MKFLCIIMAILCIVGGLRTMFGVETDFTFSDLLTVVKTEKLDGISDWINSYQAWMDDFFYTEDGELPSFPDMTDDSIPLITRIMTWIQVLGAYIRFACSGVLYGFLEMVLWSFRAIAFIIRLTLVIIGIYNPDAAVA